MNEFLKRIITGGLFVLVLIVTILFDAFTFALLFGVLASSVIFEFWTMTRSWHASSSKKRDLLYHIGGGLLLFYTSFLYCKGLAEAYHFSFYLMYLLFLLISVLYKEKADPVATWGHSLFLQLYCAGSFALLNWVAFPIRGEYNGVLVLSIFLFVWVNDTGAYIIGSRFGRHRLFERVSPKKSWEGFWGGLIAVLIVSQVMACFFEQYPWYHWLALSFVVTIFATWGDLVESLLKRSMNVKDSGRVLPGHGGMLDRLDSVIFAIPAAYVYLRLFIQN